MDFTVVNLDEAQNIEQPFLVLPEGDETFGHGPGIGLGIIKIEKLTGTRGPGAAPGLHEAAQLAGGAVVNPGHAFFVQPFGQDNSRAWGELRAHLADFVQADGHTTPGRKGFNAETLTVDPNAVAGLAAQLVHRIGVVERISYAAVFLKIQTAGYFVFHKIDAFRGAQVIENLLVARKLTRSAGERVLEFKGAFFLKKKKGLASLVHGYQMRGQALVVEGGLPVVGQSRTGQRHCAAKQQRQRPPPQTATGPLNAQGPPVPHG